MFILLAEKMNTLYTKKARFDPCLLLIKLFGIYINGLSPFVLDKLDADYGYEDFKCEYVFSKMVNM